MYLRHSVRRKDGKAHTYWRLVRSVRSGKTVRQETVAQLGELDEKGRLRAKYLARQLGGHVEPPGLFDAPASKEIVHVRLGGVKLERLRRFGDVWLGYKLWRMAKLDKFFEENLARGGEDISWATMAEAMTIARLCEPSSELHLSDDWLRKTALADILGFGEEKINCDRLYRGLDKTLPLKKPLEAHLKGLWEGLFGIQYDLLLYDVTSTYFEGRMDENPQALRGHSRDHRGDCKQVCIGLVVTREGMPLGYEVFPGNLHDSKTVRTAIESVELSYGKSDRVWIMDRGMVSEDTLSWMRAGGRRYVVGLPKSELKKRSDLLAEAEGWTAVREGVKVRYADGETQGDVIILCRSQERRLKEAAMQTLFSGHIEQALKRLKRRLDRSVKPVCLARVQRQIGRILERNSRSARFFQIDCEATDEHPSGINLAWRLDEAEKILREQSHGCYALRSNVREWTETEIWKAYIQLTQVEEAFRVHKSELGIRPVWHRRQDRVQAHILICFLAYILWKFLEQWQSRAGLGNSPRTILEELGQIQSGDIVLPTTTGEQIRLRSIVRPERAQKIIVERLGVAIPRRMSVPDAIAKM